MESTFSYDKVRRTLTTLPVRVRLLLGLIGLCIIGLVSFHSPGHSQQQVSRARNFHPNGPPPPPKPKLDDDWGTVHRDWKARPAAEVAVPAGAGAGLQYGKAAEAVDDVVGKPKGKDEAVRAGGVPGKAKDLKPQSGSANAANDKEKDFGAKAGTGNAAIDKEKEVPLAKDAPKPIVPGVGPQGAGKPIPPVVPLGMVAPPKAATANTKGTSIPPVKEKSSSASSASHHSNPLDSISTIDSLDISPDSPWLTTRHLFAFGDSWSYTAFDIGGPQPSPTNPLGNPPLPVNGVSAPPSWLHYLSTSYNATFLKIFNLAHGAATVDRTIVPPHEAFAFTATFKEQAEDLWRLVYAGVEKEKPDGVNWGKDDALFAVWFGVVDLMMARDRNTYTPILLNTDVLHAYTSILTTLHTSGARRFLLLNLPPLDLAPGAPSDLSERSKLHDAVHSFNEGLKGVKVELEKLEGAQVALMDVAGLLEGMIKGTEKVVQMRDVRNVTENCWDYNPDAVPATSRWDRFDERCGVRFDQYFWANELHTTHPVQEAIAAAVVRDCYASKTKRGFCT